MPAPVATVGVALEHDGDGLVGRGDEPGADHALTRHVEPQLVGLAGGRRRHRVGDEDGLVHRGAADDGDLGGAHGLLEPLRVVGPEHLLGGGDLLARGAVVPRLPRRGGDTDHRGGGGSGEPRLDAAAAPGGELVDDGLVLRRLGGGGAGAGSAATGTSPACGRGESWRVCEMADSTEARSAGRRGQLDVGGEGRGGGPQLGDLGPAVGALVEVDLEGVALLRRSRH